MLWKCDVSLGELEWALELSLQGALQKGALPSVCSVCLRALTSGDQKEQSGVGAV